MPIKAAALRAPSPCIPTACTGFYLGVNLTGAMTNADVIGNGVNGSLAAGGQSIGLQGGYQFASGGWFWGGEVAANYIVNTNSILTNGAATRYRVGEYLKVGTQLANILNLGGIPGPGIPDSLASRVISPYVLFGAVQSGIGQGWATGAGVEFAVTQNWFVDTRYTYVNYGSANVQPNVVAKTENLVTAGLNYKF
jgi:opacity protein-like surface antigen